MRDSDWSRRILLRSDWSGPRVAICTTIMIISHSLQIKRGERENGLPLEHLSVALAETTLRDHGSDP